MKAEKITIYDIMGIGKDGILTVTLPSYIAAVSARNLVQYVRDAHPREDGLTYATKIEKGSNTLTIRVVDKVERGKGRKKYGN